MDVSRDTADVSRASRVVARWRGVGARSAGHYAPLDALRALAISMVFVSHAAGEFGRSGAGDLSPLVARVLTTGWVGVDLFFVLSGFLIGRQLWTELRDRSGRIDVPAFWIRRGLRIWPLYFTFVIVMALLRPELPLGAVAPDAFFYSNYVQGQISGGWSLSTEEQFYIVVPILLLGLTRLGRRGAALGVVLLLLSMPVARGLSLIHAGWPALGQQAITSAIYTQIHTHADGLLVGLLISWAWVFGGLRHASMGDRRVRVAMGAVVAGAIALRAVQNDLFSFLALALLFGVALVAALLSRAVAPRLSRPRPFAVIARLSFGMYLNHELLLVAFAPVVFRALAPLGAATSFATGLGVMFGLSAAVAAATNVLIEQPGLELRDRWLRRRLPSPQAPHDASGARV